MIRVLKRWLFRTVSLWPFSIPNRINGNANNPDQAVRGARDLCRLGTREMELPSCCAFLEETSDLRHPTPREERASGSVERVRNGEPWIDSRLGSIYTGREVPE